MVGILSEAQRAHFTEHGYVLVKGLIDSPALETVQTGLAKLAEEVIKAEIPEEKIAGLPQDFSHRMAAAFEGNLLAAPVLFRKELHIPEMAALFLNDKVLKVVQEVIPAEEIRIFPNYSSRPKLPSNVAHEVSWHQDAGLSPDGAPNDAPVQERLDAFGLGKVVNCWAPLVPVTVHNGCMKFIRGSHNLPPYLHKHVKVGLYRGETKGIVTEDNGSVAPGTFNTAIDPTAVQMAIDKCGEPVDIECDPGDIVLFNNLLFHRGGPNLSNTVRWSVDWRYQDASKPTHRPQQGHVVISSVDPARAVTPAQWSSLSLS